MVTIWVPTLAEGSDSKYHKLANAIANAIESGELAQGCKLPPQRRLADALGVTVGTVTRAYGLCEQRGWVEARVGDGTYVRHRSKITEQTEAISDLAGCAQRMTDQIQQCSDAMMRIARDPQRLGQLLQYQHHALPHQQRLFCSWLKTQGIQARPEQLLFCQGAQQGIHALLSAICAPGDTVLHEAWCFTGIGIAARQLHLNTLAVPLTEDGLDLQALEQAMMEHSPKALYITPNNQNPTCIGYSKEQRLAILALARRFEVLVIEDDVNYCLDDEWSLPLWHYDQIHQEAKDHGDRQSHNPERGNVVYVSSLSKRFAGGLRQGYMLLPQALLPRVNQALLASCWMVSSLNIELACELLQQGAIHQKRDPLIRQIRAAGLAMADSLGLKSRWRGLNGFLELPPQVQAQSLVTQLATEGILLRSAAEFGDPANAVRLSIGRLPEDKYQDIFNRIAQAIREQLYGCIAVT
ncbi:aminotransferase-like domain-containing protein [Shewanella cyperi]|uniref:aminotransferase-like domain-containing protein n=1 Tax=Shewanella cyperi TaxID=2814292 RepID=UPI001A93EA61|nr:PLP-dependent aminotransferase family protein [Shewanella cyperi]QSX42234.1 PLP-dependent aminotransferase family protein [Shewanella cyperi]